MGFLSNKIWVRIFLGHPVNKQLKLYIFGLYKRAVDIA